MKNFIPVLKRTMLFEGLSEEEILAMLSCLKAEISHFKKGEFVYRQGKNVENIAVLACGKLHIQKDDYWGNRSIISAVREGEMFGEAYALQKNCQMLNDVIAVENSSVFFFDAKKVLSVCPNSCRFHSKIVENLFLAISEKNRTLVQKLGHMARRTTREKLISYLSEESKKQKTSSFSIPFNRQQLADFLSVDRSAMSNELSKLRDDGLIRFEKNRFELLEGEENENKDLS